MTEPAAGSALLEGGHASSGDEGKQVSSSEATKLPLSTIIPPNHLLHPEFARTLSSKPGHISWLVVGGLHEVTLDQKITPEGLLQGTNEPWIRASSRPAVNLHHECIFLRPDAFRVRVGLAKYFPFDHPYPVDPEFPPPHLRPFLFPPNNEVEPIAGADREDLRCGLELRADNGDIWVNPRGSSFELTHTTSPFGITGFYRDSPPPNNDVKEAEVSNYDDGNQDQPSSPSTSQESRTRNPFFRQACMGPFDPSMLPSGFVTLQSGFTLGVELLILREGETLHSGGLGRHVITNPMERAQENQTQSRNVSPFIYTTRGWGILMNKPELVQAVELSDGRKMLSMGTLAQNGMMEYIVVQGQAFQACLDEYLDQNDQSN